MHKFDFTEEMLQTRIMENLKEKQESPEKLAHVKTERTEKLKKEIMTKVNGIKVDEQREELNHLTA